MPQMAPMNWMILFFMVIMIFMLFNSLNYFSFKYLNLMPKKLLKFNNFKLTWKW
uniref:ATP synthase complex subunit 8 n=1 Tax=Ochthebius minoicus TaxID=2769891 RepID=A0A7H0DK44_9COLE|nr:ATP synthase F0 subunit 8 [Ochthebius minoicus]QNP09704.1 ATP synthase F0 subunit 8 [Ochthebius minoicus]